jgi:tetratricopeptide (TPR) repeat protein
MKDYVMKLSKKVFAFVVVVIVLCPIFCKAEIYQYKDKKGGLHFTDSLAEVPAGVHPKVIEERKEQSSENDAELLKAADTAYQRHNYRKAVEFYEKIIEFEKRQPKLDKSTWRVAVDNLGMSYIELGENDKAKQILEYGLSKDHTYPMFYYNLARVYAEMDDLDASLANLRKAFEYRNNLMPNEHLPNPATDVSFARFMRNERFLKAVKDGKI